MSDRRWDGLIVVRTNVQVQRSVGRSWLLDKLLRLPEALESEGRTGGAHEHGVIVLAIDFSVEATPAGYLTSYLVNNPAAVIDLPNTTQHQDICVCPRDGLSNQARGATVVSEHSKAKKTATTTQDTQTTTQ
jgi:hypothetical protein